MTSDGNAAEEGEPEYGETWVYESLVGVLPGVDLGPWVAVAIQFAVFETGVLLLGWWYDRPTGAIAGTVAVVVAAAGSAAMLDLGSRVRRLDAPGPYRRVLFGSSVEVVLALLAYAALLTYLFVHDPRDGASLLDELLGPARPLPAVYLLLLVAWDVCYRIGTGWWTAVAALYRSVRFDLDPGTSRAFRRLDVRTVGFAAVQLLLVPLLAGHPLLVGAIVGHVIAVAGVVGLARVLSRT